MKKILYGIGFLALSILVLPVLAEETEGFNNDICNPQFKPPVSCWQTTDGSSQALAGQGHCAPEGNLTKEKQNEFFKEFEEYKDFLKKRSDEDKLKLSKASTDLLQGKNPIPTPEQVEASPETTMKAFQKIIEDFYKKASFVNKSGEKVQCKYDDHGKDAKYGICTREAFRHFLQLIPKDCKEPVVPTLTVIPSTRCRIEISLGSNLLDQLKLEKQEAKKEANAKYEKEKLEAIKDKKPVPEREVVDYSIKLERELGKRIGKTINLISAKEKLFYFEVVGDNATEQEQTMKELLRDEDFLNETEDFGNGGADYSLILENTSVKTKDCAVDPLNNVDIGGLRPRYLVGASDGTRNLSGSVEDLTYWFQRFGRKIVGFIAAVAVFFIVWNAFSMVTSMGDADQISSSKKAIQWILIGLALAIFAYVIIKTIISLTYLSTV